MKTRPLSTAHELVARLDAPLSAPETLEQRLAQSALEQGVLDRIDMALIRSLARKAGRPDDAAFQAVIGCLIAAVKAGSLRIPLEPEGLAPRLAAYLRDAGAAVEAEGGPAALAARLAGEFDSARTTGVYAGVIGAPPEFLPLLQRGHSLYFQRHLAAEATVSYRLKALLSAPDAELPGHALRDCLDAVLTRLPLRLGAAPGSCAMVFDPRQQQALALALRKRFTVISGGPGTGKTSLAANLLRAWTRAWALRSGAGAAPPRIRLAAPTGRAAQRLADSLRRSLDSILPGAAPEEARLDAHVAGLACETLHGLLRYHPGTGEFFHQAHRPLPADLVLVDEVSMVDIFVLARLLEALEEGAALVLLGDMDQLPSVESGSVLADLVPGAGEAGHALGDHLVLLDRSHRSEAGILDVTRHINAMDGAGALAAMPAPLARKPGPPAVEADGWPMPFLSGDRQVAPGGGCRMLLPSPRAAAAGEGGDRASEYRRGFAAWLEAWIDFHYLRHAFDPGAFPGRTLATPRTASYADIVAELCAYRPREEARFQAALAWRPAGPSPAGLQARAADPDFARWLARLGEAFAYLEQARILTFTRKGWYGSTAINRQIRERLVRRWDPGASASGGEAFRGAPILILENDHAKGLCNGDVGISLTLAGRSLACFRRADSFLACPAPFLPRHELAFASTVHKAQGSEYDQVMIVLPEAGNRLLFKETLYTAITRARYFAGLYGSPEVFLEAAGRKVARESGLREFLAAVPSG